MHMQSPPVNSLSLDFLTEFCISVEKLEMDKSCRGLIITSVQYELILTAERDCRRFKMSFFFVLVLQGS